ncbi:hypothetical protein INT48_003099 [Thamnidium elegans]|uniref:Protein SCAI n=1 Tax=Thamnidium elegans TaxID=101142 RepID=A0A8H7VV12_9FUNG|nr:hypothetical protein INT48_003099 [Thamnidium elegans]
MNPNPVPNGQAIPTESSTASKDSSASPSTVNNTINKSGTTTSPVSTDSTAAIPSTTASTTTHAVAAEENETNETDEDVIKNQKLVEEFQYLLEKSQSLFSGLRDLPNTGSHRQWRPYFEKTFEVYTKLWKFQQTHRSILEHKSNYGLKRWEVGEIASKIGQLYYHYYLRTSETNYLHEAYVFYEAIHDRQYFKDILEVKNSALMIKKMRYYARFIIVCLLLNKDENVRQLISELEGLIEEYTKSFKPPDAKEWQMVLEEISTFTEAEKKLVPINLDRTPDKIEHRLSANIPERNIGTISKLKLQEAILVGNYQKQIKFSELTLDMYRMLQSLEREPYVLHPSTTTKNIKSNDTNANESVAGSLKEEQSTTTATKSTGANMSANTNTSVDKSNKRSNPHKYLLYKPSLSQLMVYISTAFKDTSDGSALLLYLSADGCAYPDQTVPGYGGGVVTNQRNKIPTNADRATAANPSSNTATGSASTSSANVVPATAASTTVAATSNNASSTAGSNVATSNTNAATATTSAEPTITTPSVHCLHPADLIPFTRKPLFLIVDSNNSTEFKNMPNVFDQPVMCLMSPIEYPSSVQDKSEIGSLFTLFLHTPLLGFCSVSDIGNLDQQKWDACVQKIAIMEKAIGDLLITDATVDKNVKRFMSDDFLYYFIVRFVLCGIFLRYHSSFKDEKSFPSSFPSLPDSVYVSSEIVTMLGDLTAIADVGTYFSLPSYATTAGTTNNTTISTATTINTGSNASSINVAAPTANVATTPVNTNPISTSPTSIVTPMEIA